MTGGRATTCGNCSNAPSDPGVRCQHRDNVRYLERSHGCTRVPELPSTHPDDQRSGTTAGAHGERPTSHTARPARAAPRTFFTMRWNSSPPSTSSSTMMTLWLSSYTSKMRTMFGWFSCGHQQQNREELLTCPGRHRTATQAAPPNTPGTAEHPACSTSWQRVQHHTGLQPVCA